MPQLAGWSRRARWRFASVMDPVLLLLERTVLFFFLAKFYEAMIWVEG